LLLCQTLVWARWSLPTRREFRLVALRFIAVMVDQMGSCKGLRRWASTAWVMQPLHLEYPTVVHSAVTEPSNRLMMTSVSSGLQLRMTATAAKRPLQEEDIMDDSAHII
jgi:hypothetical protein